ncbi:MAG TPA: sulfatase, partial [Desulfobacterales bacterium]|nr:sulfatase [Desulfobacterales bacterium]
MSPNILYIICHDLGQQLSCYGDQSVTSPNLDRLAEEGVRFENYFCAATPCSPSRGCIMTGRYAHNNGLTGLVNAGWDMPERETTIVDYLNEAGYNTYQIGFQHERRDPLKNRYKHSESDIAGCEVVADRVAEFLRAAAVKEQPFYLNTGFSEVHLPFDRKEYVPDNPDDVYVPSYLPDNKYVRQELANFHGSIKFMDEAVGKIVRALNESQLGKNTVVIFTTDHGMAFPRAKSTLYDSGIKTALIMKFPEGMVKPGVYREL